MDVAGFEIEDGQILPTQRIRHDVVHQGATHGQDEGLIAEARVNRFRFRFAKGDGEKRVFAGLGFGGVFRGEGAEGELQRRLIQTVFREIGSDILDEAGHLFVADGIDEAANLGGVGRDIIMIGDGPGFALAREHGFAFARRLNGQAIEDICIDARKVTIA